MPPFSTWLLPSLPCRLLVLLAVALAAGRATGADTPLAEQATRCHMLARSSPHDALALADRLLAVPALPPEVEIRAITCRSTALTLLGRNQDSGQMAARLHVLLQTPGLPLENYDQIQRRTAWLLLRDGLTEEGLQILEAMQERSIAGGNVSGQVLALGHIALIHAEQLGDPEGALHYQRRAFALSGHLQRPPLLQDLTLNYNHGYVLLQLRRHDEADKALGRAEDIARRLSGQDVLLHRIRSDRAEILRARGQPEAARARLLPILHWQKHNSPMGQISTLQYLARIALEQGALEEARNLAEEMLAVSEAGKFPVNTLDSLDLLAEVSLVQGDMVQVRSCLQRVRQLERDRRMGSKGLARLARLQARAEQALDPVRINVLQEASRDRVLRNAALAAGMLLLLLNGGLYLRLHRQLRQLRRLHAADAAGEASTRGQATRTVTPDLLGDASQHIPTNSPDRATAMRNAEGLPLY